MFKYIKKKILVNLEIGSYNLRSLVSEILPNNKLSILAVGITRTKGIKNGKIYSVDLFIKCIKNVLDQVESISKFKIKSLFLLISSSYIHCIYENGMVLLKGKEVTNDDILNVINVAKSIRLSNKYIILHTIPIEYILDTNKGIKNPLGLSGLRMEVKVLLVICRSNIINNIKKIFFYLNIKIEKIIFSNLITNYSLLNNNEKESNICVVDIGSYITTISFYHFNTLFYFKIFPYAGNLVTNDISYVLNLSKLESEFIKINYGCLNISLFKKNKKIEFINFMFKNSFSKDILEKTLFNIIKSRYLELLYLINQEILKLYNLFFDQYEFGNLYNIIFIGGSSQIPGLLSCAKKIFNFNVRIGIPQKYLNDISSLSKDKDIFISSFSNIISSLLYFKNIYLNKNLNYITLKKNFFLYKLWKFFFNY